MTQRQFTYTVPYVASFRRYHRKVTGHDIPAHLVSLFAALERQRQRLGYIRAFVREMDAEGYRRTLAHYLNYLEDCVKFRFEPVPLIYDQRKADAIKFARLLPSMRQRAVIGSAGDNNPCRPYGSNWDWAIILNTHRYWPGRFKMVLRTAAYPFEGFPGTIMIFHAMPVIPCDWAMVIFYESRSGDWLIHNRGTDHGFSHIISPSHAARGRPDPPPKHPPRRWAIPLNLIVNRNLYEHIAYSLHNPHSLNLVLTPKHRPGFARAEIP